MSAHPSLCWILLGTVLAPGCVPRDVGYQDARTLVRDRLGEDVRWGHPEDGEATGAVRRLLAAPLTADAAARIALLNSRALQASFERLGVARGGLIGALALPNPTLHAGLGYHAGTAAPDADVDLTLDLTRLLFLPARQGAARAALSAAAVEVAGEAMDLALRARGAWCDFVASRQTLALRRTVVEAAYAGYDAARRLRDAGNLTDLAVANEQALYEQARLDLTQAEQAVVVAREHVNAVLGLWGASAGWTAPATLPEPPDVLPALEDVEARALARSVDLELARRRYGAAARAANLATAEGWLPTLRAGVGYQREDEQDEWGPVIGLEIPLFDQGQGATAEAEARLLGEADRLADLGVRIRAAARATATRVRIAHAQVRHYRDVLQPLRARIVQQTLLRYDAMSVGVLQLLQARRDEVETARAFVEALRAYWVARAELDQILAGRLVDGAGTAPPMAEAMTGSRRDDH